MTGARCAPENLQTGEKPDDWFAQPGTERILRAQTLCMQCPLYWPCREYALAEGIPDGVFGGMTAEARARVWRRQGGRPKDHLDAMQSHLAILAGDGRRDRTEVA